MYQIVVCDDEKFTCSLIETSLLEYARKNDLKIDVYVFFSGEELLEKMQSNYFPDILFLDINLITTTGIKVAQYIRNEMNDETAQIIYISSAHEYAMQLFKTRPMDFLIKPFSDRDITETFLLAKKLLDRGQRVFEFSTKHEDCRIPLNAILYFKSNGRKVKAYVEIKTAEGAKTKDFDFYGKIDDVARRIQSEDYWRIHKSYYINSKFVIGFSYEWVEMSNGDILTISKANRKSVRDILLSKGV
jgi:DNA-binding LytR/AlgR family response regulator